MNVVQDLKLAKIFVEGIFEDEEEELQDGQGNKSP